MEYSTGTSLISLCCRFSPNSHFTQTSTHKLRLNNHFPIEFRISTVYLITEHFCVRTSRFKPRRKERTKIISGSSLFHPTQRKKKPKSLTTQMAVYLSMWHKKYDMFSFKIIQISAQKKGGSARWNSYMHRMIFYLFHPNNNQIKMTHNPINCWARNAFDVCLCVCLHRKSVISFDEIFFFSRFFSIF